jgi:hypothetical protein
LRRALLELVDIDQPEREALCNRRIVPFRSASETRNATMSPPVSVMVFPDALPPALNRVGFAHPRNLPLTEGRDPR